MAYDPDVAERVRSVLGDREDLHSKKMFGGVAYLVRGNMVCGVLRSDVILRLGPDAARQALEQPDVREFDITGRSMRGWVMIDSGALSDPALADWVEKAWDFASALPAK